MENKTKEQLAVEYSKCQTLPYVSYISFIAGYDARQPEVDALNETIKELSKQLTDIIKHYT